MRMPTPDAAVVERQDKIAEALRQIVPDEEAIASLAKRRVYESDGLTAYRQPPLVVALPSTVEQVAAVLRYCKAEGIKVVPRGAGTLLSGGALPLADGVLLGMAKFNRILEVDCDNRCVVAQPGVTKFGDHQDRRARRLLLRAGSVEPNRLHDRRQCRREFSRGALPKIRPDHQQPSRYRDGFDGWRGDPPRR